MSRYMKRELGLSSGASFSATATLTSLEESLLYCTSILPVSHSEADTLHREFTSLKGTDYAVTVIKDVNAFAKRLGIDFALSVDQKRDFQSQNFIQDYLGWKYAFEACVTYEMKKKVLLADTVMWVHHGPVQYRNEKLIIERIEDFPRTGHWKDTLPRERSSRPQREYRLQ